MPDMLRYTLWIDTDRGLQTGDEILARSLSLTEAADFVRGREG